MNPIFYKTIFKKLKPHRIFCLIIAIFIILWYIIVITLVITFRMKFFNNKIKIFNFNFTRNNYNIIFHFLLKNFPMQSLSWTDKLIYKFLKHLLLVLLITWPPVFDTLSDSGVVWVTKFRRIYPKQITCGVSILFTI